MILLLAKVIFLVIGIMYGFTCFGLMIHKQNVSSWQIFFMSSGIAGFIALQWLL